ncbi:unnamed protein product [Camellia sinensis]
MQDMFGSVRRSLVFCSPNDGGGDEGTTVGTLVVKQLLDGRISKVGTKQFQTMEVDIQACRTNTGAPQRKIGGFGGWELCRVLGIGRYVRKWSFCI